VIAAVSFAALGCAEDGDRELPVGPYHFVDVTEAAGLGGFRQVNGNLEKEFIIEGIGGGCALFDYDLDGDLDAYLTNGSSIDGFPPGQEPRDALYANDGTGRFTEVTDAAGLGDTEWTNGAFVADVNADGWPDLYLTNWGPNVLYLNEGGTFRDATEEAGVGDPLWSTSASFFDFDQDGDLDLYVANYIEFDVEAMKADRPTMTYRGITVYKGPRGLPPERDRFYRNEGNGRFTDVSEEVGITEPRMFGFQSVVLDVDQDGWLDLFVANDSQANFYWRNDGGEGFEERGLVAGLAVNMFGKEQSGMGVAVGDADGDLLTDLYVTHFSHDYSTFYRGVAGSSFVDATHRLKLVEDTEPDIAWACGFEDFDNDGDLEIYAVNGHIYPQVDRAGVGLTYAQKNDLFERANGHFQLASGGPGFEVAKVSRGAAAGDIDGDGDLDLLIENLDDTPTLLRNDGPSGNYAQLEVTCGGANRGAIGARLVVRVGDVVHLRLVGTGGSFLSSSSSLIHIGLGDAPRIDEVEVTWPDGEVEVFRDVGGDGVTAIEKGCGES
jgi:hypothetical protein